MRHYFRKKFPFSLVVMTAALIVVPTQSDVANAFGTVNQFGQNAEHARITRHALTCTPTSALGNCLEVKTLSSLAGKRGTFGAVGAPDRGRGMLTSFAHCSAGDHFEVQGYPQTAAQAQAKLTECREYMLSNLNHAVVDAADLINQDGEIRSSEVSMFGGCIYRGSQHGRAKCNVLAHMGRILHASQDFYSHSNWVDLPNFNAPNSTDNPPGLNQRGPAPWLDLRITRPAFPQGLISGCFDNQSYLGEDKGCLYGDGTVHRVRHLNVNKDTGTIDPYIGEATTERGAINDNFKHAVEAAILDTADKWQTLSDRLIETYGEARGQKMICALTRDNPLTDC
jgi:hypothetical protein